MHTISEKSKLINMSAGGAPSTMLRTAALGTQKPQLITSSQRSSQTRWLLHLYTIIAWWLDHFGQQLPQYALIKFLHKHDACCVESFQHSCYMLSNIFGHWKSQNFQRLHICHFNWCLRQSSCPTLSPA